MMTWSAILANHLGLTCLALGMERHFQNVFHWSPSRTTSRLNQIGGWALLVLSIVASVVEYGWSVGATLFVALLAGNSLSLTFLLTYASRHLPAFRRVLLISLLLLLTIHLLTTIQIPI